MEIENHEDPPLGTPLEASMPGSPGTEEPHATSSTQDTGKGSPVPTTSGAARDEPVCTRRSQRLSQSAAGN